MVTPGAAQRRFPLSFKLPTDNARSLPDVVTAALGSVSGCSIWHPLLRLRECLDRPRQKHLSTQAIIKLPTARGASQIWNRAR